VPAKPRARTARQKLELSKMQPGTLQRELMGDDIDLEKLVVYLKSAILFDTTDRIVDCSVTRTIEGASTLDLTLNDYDRSIVKSWAINAKLDIQIDGMWFRLVKTSRDVGDDNLQLTFEQREIALLRSYPPKGAPHNGAKFASRTKVTRAEFILNLIREVKEVDIPVVIPELHKVQKIQKAVDAGGSYDWSSLYNTNPGLAADINKGLQESGQSTGAGGGNQKTIPQKYLTVDKAPMTKEQMANANTIISTGLGMGVKPKLLVCAIMTAIDESRLKNLSAGDKDSAGLFQQRPSQGWGSYENVTDPPTASRSFYNHAIKYDQQYPNASYNDLCHGVQGNKDPNVYGQFYGEAVRIVTAYGVPLKKDGSEDSAANANNMANVTFTGVQDFLFYRGTPTQNGKYFKREDNWSCIQRLADDVGWRAFFIGGVFYYLTDDDLFKMQATAILTEESDGVMGIGFDYDVGKTQATVEVQALTGKWTVPPGAIVIIQDMGAISGRWVVSNFERSLFNNQADIQLSKRQPDLPEPLDDGTQRPTWASQTGPPGTQAGQDPGSAAFGGIPGMNDASRNAVVAVAKRALAIEKGTDGEKKWHYKYPGDEGGDGGPARPIPDSLWSADAHDAIDCSAFATLCYKEANCEDPNGNKYNGQGYTGTLVRHGIPVTTPQPGDLLFYGSPPDYHHVAVYIGGGMQIQIGSAQGVKTEPSDGPGPVTAIRSYLNKNTDSGISTGGAVPVAPSGGGTGTLPKGKITVFIQAGHDTGGHSDQPYGHEGQSGAAGEVEFNMEIRNKVIEHLQKDDRFAPWSADAWSASAGATAAPGDDENILCHMFVAIHYDRGTPGSGYFFGYTRGATDGRSDGTSTQSATLCNKIAAEINQISGAPPRLGDNSSFGGTPAGASGWGYYPWGSTQRAAPDNIDHTGAQCTAHCIMECGRASDGDYLDHKRDDIAKAIYTGICRYYSYDPV